MARMPLLTSTRTRMSWAQGRTRHHRRTKEEWASGYRRSGHTTRPSRGRDAARRHRRVRTGHRTSARWRVHADAGVANRVEYAARRTRNCGHGDRTCAGRTAPRRRDSVLRLCVQCHRSDEACGGDVLVVRRGLQLSSRADDARWQRHSRKHLSFALVRRAGDAPCRMEDRDAEQSPRCLRPAAVGDCRPQSGHVSAAEGSAASEGGAGRTHSGRTRRRARALSHD